MVVLLKLCIGQFFFGYLRCTKKKPPNSFVWNFELQVPICAKLPVQSFLFVMNKLLLFRRLAVVWCKCLGEVAAFSFVAMAGNWWK